MPCKQQLKNSSRRISPCCLPSSKRVVSISYEPYALFRIEQIGDATHPPGTYVTPRLRRHAPRSSSTAKATCRPRMMQETWSALSCSMLQDIIVCGLPKHQA